MTPEERATVVARANARQRVDETIRVTPSTAPSSHYCATADLPRVVFSTEAPTATEGLELSSEQLVVGTILGEGGMGRVLAATQRSLKRSVAVKTLHEDSVEVAHGALLAEARITGALEHPNILPIHQLALDPNGNPVMVMKRVEGVSWRTLLLQPEHWMWERLPYRHNDPLVTNLRILTNVCNAVQFAHERGVLHRDIKTENIMVGAFGEVYLLDWGIALELQHAKELPHAPVGTPSYMAPEMVIGNPMDLTPATDVYLLGATLHEVLTRRPRHVCETMESTLLAALRSAPYEYPAKVPEELATLCNEACAAEASARPASAERFRQRIQAYLQHHSSLSLCNAALETLRHINNEKDVALTDPARWKQLLEARFGLLQALHEWPENLQAKDSLRSVERLLLERELVLENLPAAQAMLESMAAPDAELEQAVQNLRKKLDEKQKTQTELDAYYRDRDVSLHANQRTVVLLGGAVGVFIVGGALAARFARTGTPPSLSEVLVADAMITGFYTAGVLALRKKVLTSLAGRQLNGLIYLTIGASASVDLQAWFRNDPIAVPAHYRVLALASVLGAAAIFGMQAFAYSAAIAVLGIVIFLLDPTHLVLWMPLIILLITASAVFLVRSGQLRATR